MDSSAAEHRTVDCGEKYLKKRLLPSIKQKSDVYENSA